MLKPLAGDEPGLEKNLRSFFELDTAGYELLFAARHEDDAALALARRLDASYPATLAAVLAVGEPGCPNAKVHSLNAMTRAASGEILVISDSDIRSDPGLLESLAHYFQNPQVGVVTCPYRAVTDGSAWSRLEAIGINTEFWSGVFAAQYLAPMDFAVGPTMAVRRSCLQAVGGWEALQDHLAEDFQLGRLAHRAGYSVQLGTCVVEHRIGSQGCLANLRHRLRWRRSTRRSRPAGYWGEIFANPLPWAALLPLTASGTPWTWALCAVCAGLRLCAAIAVGYVALGDRTLLKRIWMLPLQDALSLLVWVAGFFGSRVIWRDEEFKLARDGRLHPVGRRP